MVQRRRAVEQHGVLGDDLLEDIPHDRALTLDHALGRLDVLGVVEVDEALHDEGLEELERHLLGQTALVQLQLRADDDDRTAGVVDRSLAETTRSAEITERARSFAEVLPTEPVIPITGQDSSVRLNFPRSERAAAVSFTRT